MKTNPGSSAVAPRTAVALLLVALSAWCPRNAVAQAAHVHSEEAISKTVMQFESTHDRFNGTEHRSLKKPFTFKREGGIGFPLIMGDLKIVSTGSDTVLALQVAYYAKRWAFLDGSATLLLDDGSRMEIGGEDERFSGPKRDVESTGIREIATIRLSCEQVARLAATSGIDMRLHGDKGNVDVWFPREGISALRTLRIEAGCAPFRRE